MTFTKFYLSALITVSISAAPLAVCAQNDNSPSRIRYNNVSQWDIQGTPLDFAYSLDKNYIYVLTDKHQVLAYDAEGSLLGTIPVDPGVNAIGTTPYGEILYLTDRDKKRFTTTTVEFNADLPISNSPVKGNPDAPITITLFTDFECPYCKQVEPLLNTVLENNANTTKLVFKNMPLQFHKFADKAARAALSARNQGKFWEFHDKLFASKELNDTLIEDIAKSLNLNFDQWKNDMTSPQVSAQIANDVQLARTTKVTGTPTIFINGWRLQNRSIEAFQELIDTELKKK